MIAAAFRKHPLLATHLLLFGLLFIGLVRCTGSAFLHLMALYAGVLVLTYTALWRWGSATDATAFPRPSLPMRWLAIMCLAC